MAVTLPRFYDYINLLLLFSQVTTDQLMELAAKAGEVRYLRLGTEMNGARNALVEYSEQPFIIAALKMHSQEHMNRLIKLVGFSFLLKNENEFYIKNLCFFYCYPASHCLPSVIYGPISLVPCT